MKTYDEIKTILTDQLGIRDLKSYKEWGQRFCWNGKGPMSTPRKPTQEDIDLLSPDLIDNNAFWRIAEELFKTDPVANCNGTEPLDVEEANRNNLGIYQQDGFTGMVEGFKQRWSPSRIPLLEIGPGYGAFKEWCARLGGIDYYAADVYPRIPGVDATYQNGLLAETTLNRRYGMVIASNVFQHLSVNQRRAYYRDVNNCLLPNGFFMVSQMLDDGRPSEHRCENGHWWCRHYGQLTQIQRESQIIYDLKERFHVAKRCIWENGTITTLCQKR